MVNQRVLRDRLLQQAVMSAFRQALLPGQFPALLLKIEIDPRLLDVNVHPTKTEVRFLESQKIFRLVQQTLEGLISEKGSISYAPTQARNEVHIESGSRSSVFKPQILGAQEAAIWRPDTSAGPGAAIQETLDNYTEASEISHPFKGYRYVGTPVSYTHLTLPTSG